MANFCIPKDRVNDFIKAMKAGDINPSNLSKMTSEERNALFSGIARDADVGALINAEFESKLLLKNQQAGMIRWAKNLTDVTPTVKKDLVAKISKLDRVLTPQEEFGFLNDLANKKLGFEVTETEAKAITEASQLVQNLAEKKAADGTFPTEADRLAYGRAAVDLTNYVSKLKNKAEALKLSDLRRPSQYGKIISKAAGNAKAITASLDNSAVFRQGGKALFTNPNIWRKNAQKTLGYMIKQFGGKDVLREVEADIFSRPNYDKYAKANLAVYKAEEAFPESAAEKLPGFGRFFKASEAAYTGMLYRMRADLMDKYIKQAAEQGINVNDPLQLKAMAKVVNSLTGRASLGKAEPIGGMVNNIFFSPRYVKSQFDVLTGHALSQNMTSFARKKAAANLVKFASGMSGVLLTANALWPGSVDFDPRSTDFLKVKIGNTRFDVAGGVGSMVVILARLISGQSKTGSGTIKDLRAGGFGSQDVLDVIQQFGRGKLSPAAAVATDAIVGTDYAGKPTTPLGELYRLAPIGIQNALEVMADPNSAPKAAAIIADFFGVGTNTYGVKAEDSWSGTTSKELLQFKKKVGEEKFNQANQEFSNKYNDFVNSVKNNEAYKNLSENDKQTVLNTKQDQLKKALFEANNFKYVPEKKDKTTINSLVNK